MDFFSLPIVINIFTFQKCRFSFFKLLTPFTGFSLVEKMQNVKKQTQTKKVHGLNKILAIQSNLVSEV